MSAPLLTHSGYDWYYLLLLLGHFLNVWLRLILPFPSLFSVKTSAVAIKCRVVSLKWSLAAVSVYKRWFFPSPWRWFRLKFHFHVTLSVEIRGQLDLLKTFDMDPRVSLSNLVRAATFVYQNWPHVSSFGTSRPLQSHISVLEGI